MVLDPNNLNSLKYFDRDWLKIDKLYIFAAFWRKAGDLFLAFLLSLKGPMAEWLGRGLQNLLQRFESAWDLNKKTSQKRLRFSYSFKIRSCGRGVRRRSARPFTVVRIHAGPQMYIGQKTIKIING